MSSLEIRPVRAEEADQAGQLLVAAYRADYELPHADDYYPSLADVASRMQQAMVLVAVLDGRLVGTVTWCQSGSPWREIAQPEESEFRMLAVDPSAQGHGVGTALLTACEERAVAEGKLAMVLSSGTWMRAAHRIYERHGYLRLPDRDWSPVPDVQLLAYRKELRQA